MEGVFLLGGEGGKYGNTHDEVYSVFCRYSFFEYIYVISYICTSICIYMETFPGI
jgi:hypothetical protein